MTDDHVQSLLTALNDPEVRTERAATQTNSVGNVSITVTRLPTEVGDIVHSEQENGTTEAQYYFKDSRATGKLPERYRDLPNAEDAILTGLADNAVLSRLATQRESQAMFQRLDADPTEELAFTTSEIDGFRVKYETDDGNVQTVQINTPGTSPAYTEATEAITKQGRVESVSDQDQQTQDESTITPEQDCSQPWCWRCLQATGGCGACVAACSAVGPGCATRLVAFCTSGGYACGTCIQCG